MTARRKEENGEYKFSDVFIFGFIASGCVIGILLFIAYIFPLQAELGECQTTDAPCVLREYEVPGIELADGFCKERGFEFFGGFNKIDDKPNTLIVECCEKMVGAFGCDFFYVDFIEPAPAQEREEEYYPKCVEFEYLYDFAPGSPYCPPEDRYVLINTNEKACCTCYEGEDCDDPQ